MRPANYPFNLLLFIAITGVLASPLQSSAQVTGTGFIRNYTAVETGPDHHILIGRNRFRLNLEKALSSGDIFISNEVQNFFTSRIDSIDYRLREAYAELYFERSDLRIGKQIISWGRADGATVIDILSPLDLSEFLTRDFADLRTGVNALSYTRYFGSNYLQVVVNPVFKPNETPQPGERWFPRTYFDTNIPIAFSEYNREPRLRDIQGAIRFAWRSSLNYDLDIGYLFWHYPNPEYAKDLISTPNGTAVFQFRETFTRSHILMYSGTLKITDRLLFTSESALYSSRTFDYLTEDLQNIDYKDPSSLEQVQISQAFDNNRDGFLKERPWFIGMFGLQFEWSDWMFSGQLINEYIVNHDEQILQDEHYTYTTLRLQRSFRRDTFSFNGFARYHFNGGDFWINPELTYEGIDNIEASIGTQLFGGSKPDPFYGHLSFDNYAQNSFAYIQFTAYF